MRRLCVNESVQLDKRKRKPRQVVVVHNSSTRIDVSATPDPHQSTPMNLQNSGVAS
jgi:hypothetical protein